MTTQSSGIDSPRWCVHCQAWGDHHSDRCPHTSTVQQTEAALGMTNHWPWRLRV